MRWNLIILLLLVRPPLSYAQPNSASIGAIVDNVQFNREMTTALVRVLNQSGKDITGFDISVDVRYRNGRTKHFERLVELLPKMVFQQVVHDSPTLGEGALRPGNIEDVTINLVPSADKNLVLSADIKVDMVVYLDLNAEGQNQEAIGRLIALRKGHVDADIKAAEIISTAAADTVTPDPRGMALRQLRQLQSEQEKRNDDTGGFSIELQTIIHDLERDQNVDLKSYARQRNKDAIVKLSHTKIGGRAN